MQKARVMHRKIKKLFSDRSDGSKGTKQKTSERSHERLGKEQNECIAEEPITVRAHLQQWIQVGNRRNSAKQKKNLRNVSRQMSSLGGNEVRTNSSGYTTTDEIERLFRTSDQQRKTVREPEIPASGYSCLPADLFTTPPIDSSGNPFETQQSYHTDWSEEDENQPCSSRDAEERTTRKFKKIDGSSDSEEENTRLICRNYVGARQARALADMYIHTPSKRESFSQQSFSRKIYLLEGEADLFPAQPHDHLPTNSLAFQSARSQSQRFETGCFKTRYLRGRERLKKLRESSTGRAEFATLSEVLEENGLPQNSVICCSLCRLLISKNLRENYFMRPCDCLDKFVHTECALLHQYEMVRQKCQDCQTLNVDRIVCRSRSPSPSQTEELTLHRLNAEMIYPLDEPLYQRRLPEAFEHDCHICLDRRVPRHDRFEKLDSTIVRACRCRVTAHNQCAVNLLVLSRRCQYCNYRVVFKAISAKTGFCNFKIVILFLLAIGITALAGFSVLYFVSTKTFLENHKSDIILKVVLAVIVPLSTVFLIAWLFRAWIRCAERANEDAKVVIKPFRLPKPYRTRKVKVAEKWEEIPFRRHCQEVRKLRETDDVELGLLIEC